MTRKIIKAARFFNRINVATIKVSAKIHCDDHLSLYIHSQFIYESFHIHYISLLSRGKKNSQLTLLPMCGFDNSVGLASHRYRGGHGFESR